MSVTLVIQHAKRMRHIVICGLPASLPSFLPACLSVPFFFTLSDKRHDFWEMLFNLKFVF
jgi:hypothetical protein